MSAYHSSAAPILKDLRVRYPDTPFLALGQTVFWDEPMKAVLRRMLDDLNLGGRMVLGVHDTDYFARVKVRRAGQARWELMPHNDGSTKDLWSAAGEISRLFGAECLSTKHELIRHGVPFDKVARSQGADKLAFINDVTEAWGWRGLVYTGSRNLIVHRMPLKDMDNAISSMLDYGFNGTLESIVDNCCKEKARVIADDIRRWVREYIEQNPAKMLSDLYQHLFPRLFELLLGAAPENTEVGCSAHLLILNPTTALLPRFSFVDLFLNERTRSIAAAAYNKAVEGSEMYTLDKFGLGALPFDLVLPDYGRGTLRVTLRAIHVETKKPFRIPLRQSINSVVELAEILVREFGNHVTLVGKAVALISMMAREFIFVFNEEGSGYVCRTRKMNDYLRSHGIELDMHPILRMRYKTWDALEVGQARFTLPEHLASTFGAGEIASAEIAKRWHEVVENQNNLLQEIKKIVKPRDLLTFLMRRDGDGWQARLNAYNDAKETLIEKRKLAVLVQTEVDDLYSQLAATKNTLRETEKSKGDHFRATIEWTDVEEQKRAAYDAKIGELLRERRDILSKIKERKAHRLSMERGGAAENARRDIAEVETTAETARMRLARNGLLTTTGLVHSQHRPAAWWLSMADPCGNWFNKVAATTELYTETV